MAEQVHPAEIELAPNGFRLLDIPLNGPERVIGWAIRCSRSKLIESDDFIAMIYEARVCLAKIITGESGPTVETEYCFTALSEYITDDPITIYSDVYLLVGFYFPPHGHTLLDCKVRGGAYATSSFGSRVTRKAISPFFCSMTLTPTMARVGLPLTLTTAAFFYDLAISVRSNTKIRPGPCTAANNRPAMKVK
jgi:hypothetical protein